MAHHYEDSEYYKPLSPAANIQKERSCTQGEGYIDNLGVDQIAHAMKCKLGEKRRAGRDGWYKPEECRVEDLAKMLDEHIYKGDLVDIANFCMMLFNRENGEKTWKNQIAFMRFRERSQK